MIISEYSNEDRKAKVLSNGKGCYTVCMLVAPEDVKKYKYTERNLDNCTLQYAQDLAENFVMKWGEFK